MPDKITMAEQDLFNKERQRVWRAVKTIEKYMEEFSMAGIIVHQLTIQSPQHTGKDWRAIIKAIDESRNPMVAFVNADDLAGLQGSVASALADGGARWREDKPFPGAKS